MSDPSRESTRTPPIKQPTPQIFLDAEDKTAEALSKFTELEACTYASKQLGSSQMQEFMTCDCEEEWDGELQLNLACGEDSHCINRVTSVECMNRHCLCGNDCQNQRFQKREYAAVSVFQTELKGYGLRADLEIGEGQFIYEYTGEVIDEATFRQRMVEYDQKSFKHFYFMMLKSDSFIDATVRGSLARFVNHSCNPNAYVDKWVVGDKLRMGIFAKRKIARGEEITFDYNVDRYGAQSQPCYCGEPNCIKFMGGKTQTDAALLLPEGIADALGVSSKEEKQWLKENKHLRQQQSDDAVINEMFIKQLEITPLTESDVSKVMGALMKSQDALIIESLIQRIYLTDDKSLNVLIIKFHGYKTLSNILEKTSDEKLIQTILEILSKWPKVTRNKISSSQIEEVIKEIERKYDNETIKSLASDLLHEWSKLKMAYRIPKAKPNETPSYSRVSRSPEREEETPQSPSLDPTPSEEPLPDGWEVAYDPNTKNNYYYHRALQISRWDRPVSSVPRGPKPPTGPRPPTGPGGYKRGGSSTPTKFSEADLAEREERRMQMLKNEQYRALQEKERQLQELIEQSRELERKKQEEQQQSQQKPEKKQKTVKSSHKHDDVSVEAKWKHVLAKHVPNLIKKYEKEIGRDNLKGCARDLVNSLASKEVKIDPKSSPPKELDHHKLKKIKEFSKTFMEKFLVKYRQKHDKKRSRDSDESGSDSKRTKVATNGA
ncbi:uncharacterized protein SPAPADRAFT_54781 [Spathaspora passalidarum NRRL Y-27907]|uniref:Histone-lysine N-methyltransferase, H3 lysine-36 specific n=1 Tax=Spathaspora passalidarum (strain NRRL Y-27907 / 11-Y1) TaxID=619300 RepID=G3AM54_SPAPN|nr:uncharacterized protein SPAPADRAFT_54781 [Spathaspora passalidarum NRRL Y-27907]EGW32759.1 hypothetical protein SPAPADRAFT_54781 [Spathaspora passalidarum NRRL Y-27907]